ncbi:aminoglycoside 3-N-acetyltransferase [Streptacidiphilus sp. MAP12-33]|uniref:aminoglycoside N(3)-acetyltransferase n=1 Tax=Streptacidiphilus sp. MAP12-33 TaxID=3156266 RepID=UPI003514F9F6
MRQHDGRSHGGAARDGEGREADRLRAGFRADLKNLGLPRDATVLVQASYSRVRRGALGGPGPGALLDALVERLDGFGTLVGYTATPENSRTSPAYVGATTGMGDDERAAYDAALPPFDPVRTPASPGVGILSELLRRDPRACRSSHPQTSFAALGEDAEEITRRHPVEQHLGPDSPLGELYRRGGYGLLIGVPWLRFTPFHLADYLVPTLPRKTYHAKVVSDGAPRGRWIAFEDLDLFEGHFAALGEHVERELAPRLRRWWVGDAEAVLVPIVPAVDAAVRLLEEGVVTSRPWVH